MRTIKILPLCLLLAAFALGQTTPPAPVNPVNIWGVGASWNQGASSTLAQQFAGTAMYARAVADATGTYAYTVIDIVPTNVKPITVTTNVGAGVAQKMLSAGAWTIYATGAVGPSWNGGSAGWAWSAGGMAAHAIGKGTWYVAPMVRVISSNVSNQSGSQLIFSLGFGTAQ